MSTNIMVKGELIWCIKHGDTYTSRYKNGNKIKSTQLNDEVDDESFAILTCVQNRENILIYLNRKYISMNAITKEYTPEKGYHITEGMEKKRAYAKFLIYSDEKERYVCLKY